MKAAVINDPVDGFVTVKDVQLRDLKPGEALVDVEYCGLCHTDLHVAAGDFGEKPGTIIGHEGVGRVSKVAPGVTSLKVGDRVSIAKSSTPVTPPMGPWHNNVSFLLITQLRFRKAWTQSKLLR